MKQHIITIFMFLALTCNTVHGTDEDFKDMLTAIDNRAPFENWLKNILVFPVK